MGKKEKHLTLQAAMLSAAGIVGTMLWRKKDIVKATLQLRKYPEGWVRMQCNPEVYLTKTSEKSKKNLFEYLSASPFHFVDQMADGYFWMNQKEEILLLTQKKVMREYWSWTASRPFFDADTVSEERTIQDAENLEADSVSNIVFDYDMTQVEDDK